MATSDLNAQGSANENVEELVGIYPYATIESDPGLAATVAKLPRSLLIFLFRSIHFNYPKTRRFWLSSSGDLGPRFLTATLEVHRRFPIWKQGAVLIIHSPYGFILCFKWCEDSYTREDYHNDEVETQLPWFANQLRCP